jgi:hypothetical protein
MPEPRRDDDFIPPVIGVGIVLAGSTAVGQPEKFLGQIFVRDTSRFYGTNKIQRTYVNTGMTKGISAASGTGQGLFDHFEARGLDPRDRATPSAILADLGTSKVDVLTIGAHGSPGYMNMTSGPTGGFERALGNNNLLTNQAFWTGLRRNLNPGATIVLIACQLADDQTGINRLQAIANWTGANVVAPTGAYAIYPGGQYRIVPNNDPPHTPPGTPMGFVMITPTP